MGSQEDLIRGNASTIGRHPGSAYPYTHVLVLNSHSIRGHRKVLLGMAVKKVMKRVANVATNVGSASKQTSLRIRETERIGTINGSVLFGAGGFAVNPAIPATFPWLASVAGQFEKYKFHKLVFRYKNLKGTSSPGNVILSHDVDSLDASPPSSIAMTQGSSWADGAPWSVFSLDCHGSPELFTRASAVASSDLKTYDYGKLFVGTEGCTDSSIHGYLEVIYDVELMYKQPAAVGGITLNRQVSWYNWTQTGTAASAPAVLAALRDPLSSLVAAGSVTLPAGSYLVTFMNNSGNSGSSTLAILSQAVVVATCSLASQQCSTIVAVVDLPTGGVISFAATTPAAFVLSGQSTIELL